VLSLPQILTHGHADAFFGLDDLRSWCTLYKDVPYSIPVYLDQMTMDAITTTFPYMVDASKATGGGDIPSFTYNIIEHDKDFEVEGITFTPLPGKKRAFMLTKCKELESYHRVWLTLDNDP
jgi:phosphoribosyl 1,2-cyclic phosphodiesterase